MSIRVLAPSDKAVKPVHKVKLVVWHGARKHVACLRTVRSIIENMVTGVRYGFAYKMRLVYAHFPINVIIADDKQSVEIRCVPSSLFFGFSPPRADTYTSRAHSNFLGEKRVRNIKLLEGVTISESKAQKDEIILEGNDVDMVSQSAAVRSPIHPSSRLWEVFESRGRKETKSPRPAPALYQLANPRSPPRTEHPRHLPRQEQGHPEGTSSTLQAPNGRELTPTFAPSLPALPATLPIAPTCSLNVKNASSSTESTCLRGVKLLRRKFERTKTQVFVGVTDVPLPLFSPCLSRRARIFFFFDGYSSGVGPRRGVYLERQPVRLSGLVRTGDWRPIRLFFPFLSDIQTR
jgi:ribosomal protein L6P/L9E